MQRFAVPWPATALVLAGIFTAGDLTRADDFQPTGRWALVNDWSPWEIAIINVSAAGKTYEVRLIDARRNLLSARHLA